MFPFSRITDYRYLKNPPIGRLASQQKRTCACARRSDSQESRARNDFGRSDVDSSGTAWLEQSDDDLTLAEISDAAPCDRSEFVVGAARLELATPSSQSYC